MEEFLFTMYIAYMALCIIVFFTSIIYIIFPIKKEEKSKTIKALVYATIGFIIGFGGCIFVLSNSKPIL